MKKNILMIAALLVIVYAAPSFAYTTMFYNYTGRNAAAVTSDTLPAYNASAPADNTGCGPNLNLFGHNYKTAACFGNISGTNDYVKVQGSFDGLTWFDCVDDAGNAVKWTKATIGTAKKWWDGFFEHRAVYLKNEVANAAVSLYMNSYPGTR